MFEKSEYMKFIIDGKVEEAESYKTENAPDTIYKYMSFSALSDCESLTELDEKKLKGIGDNTIWMPLYKDLNDPFEMKALYYEKKILEDKGWNIEFIDKIFDSIKGSTLITSFTASAYNNIPMWAHYSNNHHGICIEYEVENPSWLYPVSYETNRVCINSILTNTISDIIKASVKKEKNIKYIKIDRNLFIISTLGAMIKNKRWSYEEEWRLIGKNFNNSGTQSKIKNFGLRVKSIYIGVNCRDEVKNRLIDICKNISCNLYKMVLQEEAKLYELECVKIN